MTPHHPDLGDPEALAIATLAIATENNRMTPCDCNHEMGDRCARCAPRPAVVPPKVGDRWGDLSPEQRAMVPDGSLLHFAEERETCEKEHGSWPYEAMHDDNVIARLGPAPTATPDPDRSGWPVLVKESADLFLWPGGATAIVYVPFIAAWNAYAAGSDVPAEHLNPAEAADAIRARLPDEVGEANSSLAEESKPAPRVERCAETSTNRGERCIKALVNGAAHEGLHMFVVGDTTQGLGEHRPQADAIRARLPEDVPATKALPSSLSTPKGPDPRDAEIATLREQVEAFRRAACVATGWGESTTPGDCTLLSDLRAMDIKDLRERAESAEATLDAYRIQRDQAREDAAGLRRLLNDAADLRAAAAEACDCDDGEVPADAELARRLRELAREPQDLAPVRRVVGIQTAALRKLISEDPTFRDIAIALAADTIDAVVGVRS